MAIQYFLYETFVIEIRAIFSAYVVTPVPNPNNPPRMHPIPLGEIMIIDADKGLD